MKILNSSFFNATSNIGCFFDELPKEGKKFILLLLSYQLNFVNKDMLVYYYRAAKNIQLSFKIPGTKLLLPTSDSSRTKLIKTKIISMAESFKIQLELKNILISKYQSQLLEISYNKILWEN